MAEKIVFSGKKWFLSNFHECPVTYKGITYKCSEAAFQAQKCRNEADKAQFAELTGKPAKHLGGKNGPFKMTPEEMEKWNDDRIPTMKEIQRAKYTQNPELAKMLLETGDAILEEGRAGFRADTFWGVNTSTGEGENHLGKILMEIRAELQGQH